MSEEPDWAMYRTLLAVLDEGSLSGAARRLALTQPTVARHIDALEAALGSDLFVRSQRGLQPTDLAMALRPHAEAMGAAAATLRRAASGTPGTIEGTVRISASEVFGVEHMPAILAKLRSEHRALTIELTLTDRVEDLLGRTVDIAVRMARSGLRVSLRARYHSRAMLPGMRIVRHSPRTAAASLGRSPASGAFRLPASSPHAGPLSTRLRS